MVGMGDEELERSLMICGDWGRREAARISSSRVEAGSEEGLDSR